MIPADNLSNPVSNPVRVLLIEDNSSDAQLVERVLAKHGGSEFSVTWIECLADALVRIEMEHFDIIVSDLSLVDSDGLATAQAIIVHAPNVPLIVLTGSNSADSGREAIRLGAQDYIVKGKLSEELFIYKLRYAIERQRLQSELLEANTALERRVTERTAQLEATLQDLSQSEQRHRSLFEGASDAIFVTDENTKIIDANPAACHLAGFAVEELKGRHYAELSPEHFRMQANQIFTEFASSGVLNSELRLLTRDGQERILRVSGSRAASGLYINIARDITERIQAMEAMQHLAYHDALTNLPNRIALHMRLGQAIHQAQADGRTMALLLLDLNNFREINDTLGHQNGDRVLVQVADRLRRALWESDMLARLGGDEFAVLLPRLADKEHVQIVLSKIFGALHPAFMIEGAPLDVQTAIGIALYPDHGQDADTLLRHADVALYNAKDRNLTHLLYDSKSDHYNPQQLVLMAELRLALQREELVLHYQPVVDLKTGQVVGVEALVRWQHPCRGLLYPDTFIPAAEKTGLITPLTTWVLANALRQQHRWHRAGIDLDVSVNLSVRNLQQPDIVVEIRDMLRSSGVRPESLTLEITESAIMVDPERAKVVLTELHELGIRFAIDDFGIGHSSLSYLKHLPVDKLKVDKSFVMDSKNPASAAIVRATIDLAHNLGLTVTAEGVEDEVALGALTLLGCDHVQGYYLGKSKAVDMLGLWLRESPWGLPEKVA